MLLGALLALVGLTLLPSPALAFQTPPLLGEPVVLDSTWTLHFHHHLDNQNALDDDDHYSDLLSIYNLQGRWGHQLLALRFDALRFFAPPQGEVISSIGHADYADEYVIEKLAWGWEKQGLSLRLGDTYVTMGRGLALSLRRVDEVGNDISVRGLRGEWTTRYIRGLVLGGWTNAANLDQFSERLYFASCTPTYPDESCNPLAFEPADRMWGGELELRWPGRGSLGLRQLLGHLQKGDSTIPYHSHGISLDIPSFPGNFGDFYAEGLWIDRDDPADSDGYGLYATLNLYFGPVTLQLEGKDYRRIVQKSIRNLEASRYSSYTTFIYMEAPSLEPLSSLEFPTDTVAGGRTVAMVRIAPTGSLLHAGIGLFHAGEEEWEPTIVHGYGGLEQQLPWGIKLKAQLGWREEEHGSLVHTDGKLRVPLVQTHSLSLGWDLQRWEQSSIFTNKVRNVQLGEFQLEYAWAPKWSLTLLYGLDDEFEEKKNDRTKANEAVRTQFLAGVLHWYPADWVVIGATAGSLRGGVRCIASTCRIYAPFSGAKLEATLRY